MTRVAAAAGPASPQVEVRAHDAAHDPPPGGQFDLVHARLVLVHIPDREKALASLVSVLRPGGWLFVEDADPALQPLELAGGAGTGAGAGQQAAQRLPGADGGARGGVWPTGARCPVCSGRPG